jgi:hypothetical protein
MLKDNYREQVVASQESSNSNDDITDPAVSDEEIETTDLEDICTMVIREAAEWTNRFQEEQLTEVMNDCWPIIVRCSCIAYLNRGAEGLGSQSELGQQNVYNDWVKIMHQQITNRRYVI